VSSCYLSVEQCLVVIPARNEAATVASVIMGVREALNCAVVVVNDGSTDDTVALAQMAGATVLDLPFSLGAWGAAQTGIRYAHRHGYKFVITLDADGQHHPEELPMLFEAHKRGQANVVIGTFAERLSLAKRMAWRYFRFLTGLKVHDFTSGLRIYDEHTIAVLAGKEASLLDYQDVGVLMLLRKKGFVIEEVPTVMSPRRNGGSRVFASWFLVARYMLSTTVLAIAQRGGRCRKLTFKNLATTKVSS